MSPRRTHAYKPLSLRRRAWLTIGAVVVGGAGVATYAVAGPSSEPPAGAKAREPSIHTLELDNRGAGRRGLDRQATKRFSAVLVTWDNPEADAKGTPEVRTRDLETGEWSGWQKLEDEPSQADGAEGERAAARGGTASVWTDDSDGVEVRVVNATGTQVGGQPAGMDVKLLDPGTDPEGAPTVAAMEPAAFAEETTEPTTTEPATTDPATTEPTTTEPAQSPSVEPTETVTTTPAEPTGTPSGTATDTASPEPSPTVPEPRPSTVVKPPVITQAEWGASTDYDGTPAYGTGIKAAVIHHTGVDGDNGVSCADSRARMRSIQQEHFARGYYDIGYNFVVDRCGQIFEGRSGGMDLPVTGAHDVGFNTDTLGISYIGNFESAQPSRAAMDSIARVVAWKFGMYGIDPTGKVTLTSGTEAGVTGNKIDKGESVTLPRVFGHRDTNNTACPGKNLYPKLSRIAALAKTPGISHALATSDFNRDGLADLAVGTPRVKSGAGSVSVLPGGTGGPVSGARRTLMQSSPGVSGNDESGDAFGTSTAWGDVNGDGHADLAIGVPGEDDTSGHRDRGSVVVMYGPGLNTGFGYTTSGVTETGAKLGTTVAVGDFDGDGKADVFAAGPGNGGNWNARHTGGATKSGTLTSATGALAHLDAASGDFNRDGYADIALNYRDTGGVSRVVRFAGSASGLTKAGVISVKGGRSLAAGDINGNGYDDIVIGQPAAAESGGTTSGGRITMLLGTSSGFTTTGMKTVHQDTTGVPGGNESGDDLGASVSVGDYNGDGYADVLAGAPGEDLSRAGVNRKDAGSAILFRGTSSGITGSGAVFVSQDTSGIPGATESGDRFGSAVSLTDLSGYGRADLTFGADGEDTWDGAVLYLPSNGSGLGYGDTVFYGRGSFGLAADLRLGNTLTP
ncbi:FG-GAP-like repeat-containing protein [Streptomyces sp. NRRL WC-3626]|uniref:FG-GAP-like repeat-containing protein n=1 Tax=Streptomyces sp. NRRL WC-3626 TaxID=1463926 RepID=UPI0004C03262|nr:FG-GAP-like repeat-containing protein [Streptomyces sp. NRRL WC-3626]